MSKQVMTTAKFATNLVTYAITSASASDMRTALIEYAPKLTKADRVHVDEKVARAIGASYGVKTKHAEKNGVLSMLCFAVRDDEGNVIPAARNAATALSRARSVLLGKKKTASAPNGDASEATLTKLEKIAAETIKGHDKAQIKALKQRVTAVLLMLSA